MQLIYACLCLSIAAGSVAAPASGFAFPEERRVKKIEPIITPPILPILEHLERDPSTLRIGDRANDDVKPKFGGGFNVRPSGNGGLTASVSSSASGAGLSHSASQSFSFGFNEGFSASHSASQASSFNGFGSGFSGSQASSQAASFSGSGAAVSGAASSASSGGFGGSSQSASSAFAVNTNSFQAEPTFGEGIFDIRQRGIPTLTLQDLIGRRGKASAAAFKIKPNQQRNNDFLGVLVSI